MFAILEVVNSSNIEINAPVEYFSTDWYLHEMLVTKDAKTFGLVPSGMSGEHTGILFCNIFLIFPGKKDEAVEEEYSNFNDEFIELLNVDDGIGETLNSA